MSEPTHPIPDADHLGRQDCMRAARDEFNAIWREDKAQRNRAFAGVVVRAELLAWEFFLRGKGLKA